MSKRNLNRRQRWRIEKIQAERVARSQKRQAQLDADVAATLGDTRPGLVTAHYGRKVEISGTDGVRQRCHFRANLEQLVVGDQVLWQPAEGPGDGVVTAIVPRTSVLKRPDNYGKLKPVAANVDLMLIVFAPAPTPSSQLLDRYLVAAELSGIRPALVLNKADLVDDDNRAALTALCDIYRKLDYPVIEASATDTGNAHAAGLAALKAALDGHTSVFVGQSGVGKSSLVNALLPDADIATNVLSDVSGLGQHTTTTAQLLHLPAGGNLIDSPGIREFGLWHIDEEELLRGYVDLAPLAGHCRFRNCSHRHEPGCALIEAAESGAISQERLDNFFRIADTLDEDARQRYE